MNEPPISLKASLGFLFGQIDLYSDLNIARLSILQAAKERAESRGEVFKPFLSSADGRIPPLLDDHVRAVLHSKRKLFSEAIDRHVMSKFRKPYFITAHEIVTLCENFLIVLDEHYDAAYELCFTNLQISVRHVSSDPFPIATGDPCRRRTAIDTPDTMQLEIGKWRFDEILCDLGIIRLVGDGVYRATESELGHNTIGNYTFMAVLEGMGTETGMRQLARSMPPVIRSLIRSYSSLSEGSDWYFQLLFSSLGETPFIGFEGFPSPPPWFAAAMRIALHEPIMRDSIDRRLRNAIYLLAEADKLQHPAIGLALSCAAMEALLCRRGEGIVNSLSKRGAVLLEPDPRHRPKAIALIKKLYDHRSEALHGTRLDSGDEDRCKARFVAAGLLMAMFERRAFVQRTGGDPEMPKCFFEELDMLSERGSAEEMSVTPSPVRVLWQNGG